MNPLRFHVLSCVALVAATVPAWAQQAGQGGEVAPAGGVEAGRLQRELALREVESRAMAERLETQQTEISQLREQLAASERQTAELRASQAEAEARLRALGSAPVVGGEAVQRRLVDAIGAAVELGQRGEQLRRAVSSALEELTLVLGRGGLAEPDQVAVGVSADRLRAGLAQLDSEATAAQAELTVAEYDPELRLAILAQGSEQGLVTGLRLSTDRAARAGAKEGEITPEQQLLVVEVRPRLAGAIQLDDNAPDLVAGEILKPVLETRAN